MIIYCPFCQSNLAPDNEEEVKSGEHSSLIYTHKPVYHDEDFDFEAMH